MKHRHPAPAVLFSAALLLALSACADSGADSAESVPAEYPNARVLALSGDSAALDGQAVAEYDYVWSYDPSSPEPSFTGTKPGGDDVYIAHDIIYYPSVDPSLFSQETYDGETEWVTHFTASGLEDYLFGTLPVLGSDLPADMMHDAEEAYRNPVLHITKAGTYLLEGQWSGQIFVDLAGEEDCFADSEETVTLLLNGVSVECGVAPAVVFYDAYECDNTWEDREEHSGQADLSDAGAKIVLMDGTENNVTGSNVFRLLKPEYKEESGSTQKKLWKTDGALYSFVSLLIDGEEKGTGILNITSTTYEGLDSELHLSMNGGYVNIVSQDDGINVNEDGVSVFAMNGGHLTIFAGQGSEGDVIDSNGFIAVNGGFLAGTSPSPADNLLDADCGSEVSDEAVIVSSTSGAMEGMAPGGPGGPMGTEPPEGVPPGQMPGQEPPDKPDGMPPADSP